jgi:hypothetical protein
MALFPQQSFQHTLREISVNRANPCELPRELISNSYDAQATEILIFPLMQKRGLLFFDNGTGLSIADKDKKNDVTPYVAFFSIGKGTKTAGQQIGYKCQGSKLCFAARRFSVITRGENEKSYRWKIIDNPKQTLDTQYDISGTETTTPWLVLREKILPDADERTTAILEILDEEFFRGKFTQGTLLVIEEFETDSYDTYFSVEEPNRNYLYNYVKYYTAHGDIRRISKEGGFASSDVRAVRGLIRPDRKVDLQLWTVGNKGRGKLVSIPQGWHYLPPPEEKTESPAVVHQIRNGRFHARHATTFKYADRHYSVILAIDGNRRALEGYEALGRRGNKKCGITMSDLRGVLLASNGIAVCSFKQLFDLPLLEEWKILLDGTEHFVLIIDGNFELVTNRDALAPSSLATLRDQDFTKQIRLFLQGIQQSKEGDIFAQLIDRLNRETTRHEENKYIENNNRLRHELTERDTFTIKGVPSLIKRPFFAPERGEEHFVGALYTMFAHLIEPNHPLARYWIRPLTFAGLGIDALAIEDENKTFTNENLKSVEYKFSFSIDDQFNHPLSVTDRIICWQMSDLKTGDVLQDSYRYQGIVKEKIVHEGRLLGVMIRDIQNLLSLRDLSHDVPVLNLRALLEASFDVTFRPGGKPQKVVPPGADWGEAGPWACGPFSAARPPTRVRFRGTPVGTCAGTRSPPAG